MIAILVVDDDAAKMSRVTELCSTVLDGYDVQMASAATVSAALRKMRNIQYDLMILDLNLPMREGDTPRNDGGVRILHSIAKRRPGLQSPKHIVGLSAYDELVVSESQHFAAEMWSLLKYDASSDEWERKLAAKLLHLATSGQSQVGYRTDLAIITALHSVELEAVLALPVKWKPDAPSGDDTIYHQGEFVGSQNLSVVCAASTEMGMSAAAALASKMIVEFRPRFICMVGIAAGARTSYSFGDVLVATHAYDYGAGKTIRSRKGKSIFQPAPEPIEISRWIRSRVEVFRMDPSAGSALTKDWATDVAGRLPVVRPGPFATGAAVVANRAIIKAILAKNRKVIAIEMEVYGVLMAAKVATQPRPLAFAMKSVCDFGGRRKDDRYQAYAAHTSARCLYEFALKYLADTQSRGD